MVTEQGGREGDTGVSEYRSGRDTLMLLGGRTTAERNTLHPWGPERVVQGRIKARSEAPGLARREGWEGSEGEGLGFSCPPTQAAELMRQDPERGPAWRRPLVRDHHPLRGETPPRASQGRRAAQTSA